MYTLNGAPACDSLKLTRGKPKKTPRLNDTGSDRMENNKKMRCEDTNTSENAVENTTAYATAYASENATAYATAYASEKQVRTRVRTQVRMQLRMHVRTQICYIRASSSQATSVE
jgi:head-tail adaptor